MITPLPLKLASMLNYDGYSRVGEICYDISAKKADVLKAAIDAVDYGIGIMVHGNNIRLASRESLAKTREYFNGGVYIEKLRPTT